MYKGVNLSDNGIKGHTNLVLCLCVCVLHLNEDSGSQMIYCSVFSVLSLHVARTYYSRYLKTLNS